MQRAGKNFYYFCCAGWLMVASFNTTAFAGPIFDEHFQTAVKLYKKHEFRKAIKELNIAIEAEPNNFEGYWKRGKCYSETDSPEEGMPDFAKALKLNPKLADIWVSRGLAHVRLKENRMAKEDYKVAITLDPKNGHAIRLLLVLCLRESDIKTGIKYASLAINNKVNTSENLQRRGMFYALTGDRKNMQADFNVAIELAQAALATAKNEKTTDASDSIADRKKDLADVYSERGKAFVALKDYEPAVKDFEQGVGLVPDTGKYKCNLGGAMLLMHDDKRALDILTEACKQDSDSASAHSNRGVALERMGKHAEAKKEFELAVQHDPIKSKYLASHARVALTLGNTDEAADDYVGISSLSSARSSKTPDTEVNSVLEQFDNLIKLNPKDAANFYNRGVINFSQGRYGDAKKDFANFLTLQNDFGESPIYGAILLSITYKNLHKMREAEAVIAHAKTVTGSAWTKQLLGLFTEEISFADFMDSHQSGQRELAANCFLGLKYLAEGNKVLAQQKLKWVREHGNPTQDEYLLAVSGLNRLSGVKASTLKQVSSKSATQSMREPEISFK
jgi:tetratricopeptide (TPR) repeat protein